MMSDQKDIVIRASGGPPEEKKQTSKLSELLEEIDEKYPPIPWHTINKPVYLVVVLSEFKGLEKRAFVSAKLDRESAVVKLVGLEVDISVAEQINNLEDAEKHAKREQLYNIEFPWHRVLSIRNITYRKG